MPNYNKPYLTVAQQRTLLKSRGMIISDDCKADSCLAKIGYYRLSAYWYPFRKSIPDVSSFSGTTILDEFRDDTTFSAILDLYIFDKKLRLIVLDAVERIEICLRTDIALLLGQKDPKAHRDPALFHGNFSKRNIKGETITEHQKWLNLLDQKFKKSKEDFAQHFKNKYAGDHLPIWIASELWDFGALSYIYEGMKISDKDKIASHYGVASGEVLQSWLRCLNDVRNLCAHHSRLWNRPLVNQPKVIGPADFMHIQSDRNAQTRLYAALLIIQFLLKTISPLSTWKIRLTEHLTTFPDSSHISMVSAGFPLNWEKQSIWK